MSQNINHVSHLKSKIVIDGKPKLPTPEKLIEGELAINYAEGVETISLKNESGSVVTFSSDDYYTAKKLGSAFTGANSAVTVTDAINELSSSAITSMDGYVMAESGTPVTSADTLNQAIGKVEKQHYEIVDFIEQKELVISASLNDLNSRFDGIIFKKITQSDYDNLVSSGATDQNTLYIITD